MNKNFLPALSVMIGYVIGVGMFSLPFLVSRAGVLSFFILLALLGSTQYFIHLIYSNIILATPGFHRMPGYAGEHLGKNWKHIVFVAKMIGNLGALLAYIIITGIFLNQLLGPIFGGNEFFYASLLFFIEAAVIYFGVGFLSRVELLMTTFLLLVVIMIVVKGHSSIQAENFIMIDWRYLFLPYGAILFSLWGATLIPETEEMLREEKGSLKKIVSSSIIISAVFYLLFIVAVVFISGAHTSREAIVGLKEFLGNGVITLLLIFGLVVTFTSFVAMGLTLKKVFWYDLKIGENLSWAIACFVPFFLFLLGLQDFIKVIGLVGSVGLGIEGILIILMYRKLVETKNKNREESGRLVFLIYPLIAVLLLGVVYEIIYFIR